jgi:ribosomal protein S18 acetylase RimI-like enzyme
MTRLSTGLRSDAGQTSELSLRAFDPDRDYPAMVELITAVNHHDHVDWFPTPENLAVDWARVPSFDPARDHGVVEVDGRFIAAAGVDWRERAGKVIHNVEIWTHPDVRRQGLGRRLLAWSEARARESVADGSGGPPHLPHFLGGGVQQTDVAGVGFATSAGYAPVRYGFVMRRPLGLPIPDAPLPAGLEVRPVRPEDHRAIWVADNEAFRDHWEAAVRHEEDFVHTFGHPDVDTSLWQVAWDGDEVAGSIMNGIYREENVQVGLDIGWLDHVSVRRPWRERGLASALIVRSLTILRERGMSVAALGVDAENPTGALGLYERYGFRPHQTWVTYRKPL